MRKGRFELWEDDWLRANVGQPLEVMCETLGRKEVSVRGRCMLLGLPAPHRAAALNPRRKEKPRRYGIGPFIDRSFSHDWRRCIIPPLPPGVGAGDSL